MFEALQETVDRLAAALGRAVVLQDADFALISSSAHFGEIDPAQIALLSDRRPGAPVIEVLRAARVQAQQGAVTLHPDPDRGLEIPRWVTPLRTAGQLHGLLTVLVSRPLDVIDQEVLEEAAQTLTRLLEHSARSIADVNAIAESEMLGLISEDPDVRALATADLLGMGMFMRSRYFVAFHLDVPVSWAPWEAPAMRDVITRLLMRAITTPMIDDYSFVPTSPHAFILVGFQRPPRSDAIALSAHSIERELAGEVEGMRMTGLVGVGGVVPELTRAWQSYEQAIAAVSVARMRGSVVASWDEDPVSTALLLLLGAAPASHLVPRPLRLLDRAPDESRLLLERFLEHAGQVPAAAEALGIHRATVYQRLARLSEMLGVDLADGETRLMLHAWLIVRGRQGFYSPEASTTANPRA